MKEEGIDEVVSRVFYYLPLGRNCYSGEFVRMKLHFLCHSRTLLENSPCFSIVQLNAFHKPSGLTEREGSVRVNFDTFESVLGCLTHPQLSRGKATTVIKKKVCTFCLISFPVESVRNLLIRHMEFMDSIRKEC
jgi:hypothetical protein